MTRETGGYYADAGENAAPMFLVSPDAQKHTSGNVGCTSFFSLHSLETCESY